VGLGSMVQIGFVFVLESDENVPLHRLAMAFRGFL
jgi:hypothetical protein